jgi:hypothetical protein
MLASLYSFLLLMWIALNLLNVNSVDRYKGARSSKMKKITQLKEMGCEDGEWFYLAHDRGPVVDYILDGSEISRNLNLEDC